MASEIQLGGLENLDVRPRFRANIASVDIIIEFDSSALLKLTDGRANRPLAEILDAQRSRIGDAARALFDNGFCSNDVVPCIILTAMDLI